MGVILYTFILGRPPYETTDVKATYRRIRRQYIPPERHISRCQGSGSANLAAAPEDRPSLESMRNDSYFYVTRHHAVFRALPVSISRNLVFRICVLLNDVVGATTFGAAIDIIASRQQSTSRAPRAQGGNGTTQHRSQNGARGNQPQTARPASRPYEQGIAAAVPEAARERRAPQMRGSDVRPPSRNNSHKAGGSTAVQKANAVGGARQVE